MKPIISISSLLRIYTERQITGLAATEIMDKNAMTELQTHLPFTELDLVELSNVELAILDQFSNRFGKLQDLMGAKLFPAVLELTKV